MKNPGLISEIREKFGFLFCLPGREHSKGSRRLKIILLPFTPSFGVYTESAQAKVSAKAARAASPSRSVCLSQA